jgi:hypothetical protein
MAETTDWVESVREECPRDRRTVWSAEGDCSSRSTLHAVSPNDIARREEVEERLRHAWVVGRLSRAGTSSGAPRGRGASGGPSPGEPSDTQRLRGSARARAPSTTRPASVQRGRATFRRSTVSLWRSRRISTSVPVLRATTYTRQFHEAPEHSVDVTDAIVKRSCKSRPRQRRTEFPAPTGLRAEQARSRSCLHFPSPPVFERSTG